MLQSCIKPCEVLVIGRHLLVTKSSTFQYVALQQSQHQLRRKSSRVVPKGQTAKKHQNPKATSSSSSSRPRSFAPDTRKETSQQPQELKTEQPQSFAGVANTKAQGSPVVRIEPTPQRSPAAQSYTPPVRSHGDNVRYRPLLLEPFKPAPNQDLSSTRPAELVTPEVPKKPDLTYFYRLGKAYLSFYKTGLWNIWNNRKEYNQIKARLGTCSLNDAALYGGQLSSEPGKARIPTISRREYQLCLRTRHDLGKLIPFGSVFAICGEFTPLVITFLPTSLVPFTVRIPKQVQHDRKWFVKRLENDSIEHFLKQMQESGDTTPAYGNMLAFLHGVSPVANLSPVVGLPFYHFWVKPRLIRRGLEILADTALIRREGGFGALEPVEVFEYANKFFCHHLIWRSNIQLQVSGKIEWDPKTAAVLASELEKHANYLLKQDWEHIPEEMRFRKGLPYEDDGLAFVQDKEKEYKRTGKLPG